MTLREWRRRAGMTRTELARLLGVTVETVRRYELPPWAPASRVPGRAAMRRIHIATAGAVTPNDFHDLPFARAS